ncbi:MAG TPA: fibronectin type III domain-containing protein, partial [Streptosporangiaceae bacterium]|nr:fibronectin type III domain-containing protein [Streptosporangiaceae bacterium]
MKSLRLVPRYRPAALLALAVFGLAVTGAAGAAPAAVAAVRAPQARVLNPSPPTGLTAVAGNGQVSLSWSPPTSNGGAAIIGYDVFQGGSAVSGLVGGTSYTVTGLTNGTTYSFSVDAVNDAQLHSAPSSPASATPVAPVTAPGAPGGLTAAAGDAQVSLSWQAPSADGGAAVTSYNVYQGGRKAATVTGTGATVQNLSNGTTYSFTVTAVNKAGEGPASGAASATPKAGASASASTSASGSASAPASAGASASGSASSPASAAPAGGAGAGGTTAGSAGPSGQQTGAAVLASNTKKMPKPVLFTLAALALAAAGAALTLTTRRVRKGRRTKRPPAAPPVDVRAVPEIGPPSPVSVHEFTVEHHELSAENHEVVMEETYT